MHPHPLSEDDLPPILRNRPRRPALSSPSAEYFDALPARVLTRIRAAEAPVRRATFDAPTLSLSWPRLRLALASATLSAAFVAAFWLARPALPVASASEESALASINHTELVEYLTDPTSNRLTTADLTALSSADYDTDTEILNVPLNDLDAALDELPLDETYL